MKVLVRGTMDGPAIAVQGLWNRLLIRRSQVRLLQEHTAGRASISSLDTRRGGRLTGVRKVALGVLMVLLGCKPASPARPPAVATSARCTQVSCATRTTTTTSHPRTAKRKARAVKSTRPSTTSSTVRRPTTTTGPATTTVTVPTTGG